MNYKLKKTLIERQHSWILVFDKIGISTNVYEIIVTLLRNYIPCVTFFNFSTV